MRSNKYTREQLSLDDAITIHFKWKDALYHSQWDCFIFPTDQEKEEIFLTALKLERIQAMFPKNKMIILSWLRIPAYNEKIKGSENSAHMTGEACDFVLDGLHSSTVREKLIPHLDTLNIRMEQLKPHQNWVHIDRKPPGRTGRYFVP